MNDCKFEAGKEYLTRDGRKARIYATDGGDGGAVHGAICGDDGWFVMSWHRDGSWLISERSHNDLMPPKRGWWVNLYDPRHKNDYDLGVCAHATREGADAGQDRTAKRIACVYVEEGDGL